MMPVARCRSMVHAIEIRPVAFHDAFRFIDTMMSAPLIATLFRAFADTPDVFSSLSSRYAAMLAVTLHYSMLTLLRYAALSEPMEHMRVLAAYY